MPLGQQERLEYDAQGNLIRHTDFNGQVTSRTYDNRNRLVQINHADGRIETRDHDANGQLLNVAIDGELTSYAYQWNRLVQVTYPTGRSINYNYDGEGNRIALNTGEQAITYGFDALNRLQAVTESGQTTRYQYNAVGNRASVDYPNGVSAIYYYDVRNRLTRLEHRRDDSVIAYYHYLLAATGQRQRMSDHTGRIVEYRYDELYRLVEEEVSDVINGNRLSAWTYDAVGNRLTQSVDGDTTTYTYDANDRLITESGAMTTVYTYDANGNTLSKTSGLDHVTYEYNSQNHVVGLDKGFEQIAFTYDYRGVRQSKTVGGNTTFYLVDKNRPYAQVLEEYDESLTAQTLYLFGDDLIQQKRGNSQHYFQYDGLGSTRALTDRDGNLTDSYNYTAFGELDNSSGTTENSYLYTGEQFDGDLEQYYLRARYYDPSVGRLSQMDTYQGRQREPVTLHKYLYGNADPVNHVDPSGNVSLSELGVSMRTISIALTRTVNAVQFFDSVFDSVELVWALKRASRALPISKFKGAFLAEEKFAEAMRHYDEVPKAIAQNIGRIAHAFATCQKGNIMDFIHDKKGKKPPLVVFGPTPYAPSTPWVPFDGPKSKIGKVKIGKKTRDIVFAPGKTQGKGGSLIGLGHLKGRTAEQWMRLDWHPLRANAGPLGSHHEAEYNTSFGNNNKWHLHTCSARRK